MTSSTTYPSQHMTAIVQDRYGTADRLRLGERVGPDHRRR